MVLLLLSWFTVKSQQDAIFLWLWQTWQWWGSWCVPSHHAGYAINVLVTHPPPSAGQICLFLLNSDYPPFLKGTRVTLCMSVQWGVILGVPVLLNTSRGFGGLGANGFIKVIPFTRKRLWNRCCCPPFSATSCWAILRSSTLPSVIQREKWLICARDDSNEGYLRTHSN